MTIQLDLPFESQQESQAERCRRILAGVVGVTTAKAMTFDEQAALEAERLAHPPTTVANTTRVKKSDDCRYASLRGPSRKDPSTQVLMSQNDTIGSFLSRSRRQSETGISRA